MWRKRRVQELAPHSVSVGSLAIHFLAHERITLGSVLRQVWMNVAAKAPTAVSGNGLRPTLAITTNDATSGRGGGETARRQ